MQAEDSYAEFGAERYRGSDHHWVDNFSPPVPGGPGARSSGASADAHYGAGMGPPLGTDHSYEYGGSMPMPPLPPPAFPPAMGGSASYGQSTAASRSYGGRSEPQEHAASAYSSDFRDERWAPGTTQEEKELQAALAATAPEQNGGFGSQRLDMPRNQLRQEPASGQGRFSPDQQVGTRTREKSGNLKPHLSGSMSRTSIEDDQDPRCEDTHVCMRWQFSARLAARPGTCAVAGLALVLVIIITGLIAMPMQLETNFDSFLKTDVESSIKQAGFDAALDARSSYSRRLQDEGAVVYMSKELFLAYETTSRGGDGIFSSQAITDILRYEQHLLTLPEWQELCGRADPDDRGLCDPGLSFANYMLPSLEVRPNSIAPASLTLDGLGWEVVPTRTAITLTERHALTSLLLPQSVEMGERNPVAQSVRSAFRFRIPCCSALASAEVRKAKVSQFTEDWQKFFADVLLPELNQGPVGESIKVWYEGTDFFEFEVKEALSSDYSLAACSLIFVLLYILFHTRSPLLAVMGPIIALLAVPLTYVITALFFGVRTVSFTSFLSLFLIVGFGADVIFVYTDYWRQACREIPEDNARRLAWTYRHAAKSSLATTATTALSFFCNLASVIRALRQFGFFMGLCVMLAWLMVSLIYVPLCVLDETHFLWCRLERHKPVESTPTFKDRLWRSWAGAMNRRKKSVFGLCVLCFILFIGTSIPNAKQGEGMPSIFPDGHNQNKGREIFDLFDPSSDSFGANYRAPPQREEVCSEQNFSSGSSTECSMFWCEATQQAEPSAYWDGNGTCTCKRRYLPPCGSAEQVPQAPVTLRLAGPATLDTSQLQMVAQYVAATAYGNKVRLGVTGRAAILDSTKPISSLVLQEWETGHVELEQMMQTSTFVERQPGTDSSCGWEDLCFCGGQLICKLDASWQDAPMQPTIPSPSRRLESTSGRILHAEPDKLVAKAKRSKVRVVFGLDVPTSITFLGETDIDQSWKFSRSFDPSQPWAQRNMFKFCQNLAPDLHVTKGWCWVEDFRLFVFDRGERFPVRAHKFHAMAKQYNEEGTYATRGPRYTWFIGDELKAVYFSFETNVDKNAKADVGMEHKKQWDTYVDNYNLEAWKCARGAFHISDLWVNAEAQSYLLVSTLQSLLILFILAFLGMLAITKSSLLSIYVCLATLFVVAGLAFFITTVMNWDIGLIEVIAIIYFIGYALDYSLHIANKYSSLYGLHHEIRRKNQHSDAGDDASYPEPGEQRSMRTTFALTSIGGAALGCAATTAGASLFLTFCTLTIFKKLGSMCLTVTVISIITALGPLPAGLILFGPIRPGICQSVSCTRERPSLVNGSPRSRARE